MTQATSVQVELVAERVTLNTVRFREVRESEDEPEQLGMVYVPKATLEALGVAPRARDVARIRVTLEAA